MCEELNRVSTKLDQIIEKIVTDHKSYSINEIYKELEDDSIYTKRYEPGTSIEDYLDSLATYEVLSMQDNRYVSPDTKIYHFEPIKSLAT